MKNWTHIQKNKWCKYEQYFWMKVNSINNLSIEFNCQIIRIFGKNVKIDWSICNVIPFVDLSLAKISNKTNDVSKTMLIIAQIMLQINLNFSINEHVKNFGIMVTNETNPMAKVYQTKILNVRSSKMKLPFNLRRDLTTNT